MPGWKSRLVSPKEVKYFITSDWLKLFFKNASNSQIIPHFTTPLSLVNTILQIKHKLDRSKDSHSLCALLEGSSARRWCFCFLFFLSSSSSVVWAWLLGEAGEPSCRLFSCRHWRFSPAHTNQEMQVLFDEYQRSTLNIIRPKQKCFLFLNWPQKFKTDKKRTRFIVLVNFSQRSYRIHLEPKNKGLSM